MKVRLVAYTEVNFQALEDEGYQPHYDGMAMDELAEASGRFCYESWRRPNPDTAANEGYLANIIDRQHFSILEHASVTFALSGVSRSFTHELVRHRHLSFSQLSQRYVDESNAALVIPPGASAREVAHLHELHKTALATYTNIYEDRITHGATRKQARQAARAALSNATETRIIVSGNLRAWREVLVKRLSPGADLEFQLVAREILNYLHSLAPNSIQDLWE
jgi:thymidylate synthase (FAD)